MNEGYRAVLGATERDRLALFLSTAGRLGTPVQNVEKDPTISPAWTSPSATS